METKKRLVDNIDDIIWRKFAGYCKIKGKKIGVILTVIIGKYLKDEGLKEDKNKS